MDPAQNKSTSQSSSSQPNQTWSPPPPDWSVSPVNLTPAEANKSPQPQVVSPQSPSIPASMVTEVVPESSVAPNPASTISMEPTANPVSNMPTTIVGSPPKKPGGGERLLIVVLLLIMVGVLGTLAYFLLLNKYSTPMTSEPDVSPSATSSAQTPVLTASNHELLYIKSSNIYHYSLGDNKETQLTLDGNQQIQYRMPKFAGNLISFVRCDHKSVDDRQPYSCSLVKQQINGSTPVEIARIDSKANSNGVHIGAQIKTYAWDKAATQAAYLAEGFDINSNTITNLFLGGEASGSAINLDSFAVPLGRGGSLNDSISLEFAPDGKKLILNNTFNQKDRGSLLIYDLLTQKLVWSRSNTWIAFAHWLDNSMVIAKLQSILNGVPGPWNLVKIDVSKLATDPLSTTTIVEAPTWYGIEPLSASTSASLVFWTADSSPSAGIVLEQLDLGTKIKKTLMKNLVKLAALDKSLLLVNTMKTCDVECGMDVYNGYTPDAVALYQLDTNKLQTLNLASGSAQPSEFSIK